MKKTGFLLAAGLLIGLWLALSCAGAETARVVTPGGKLNMRRSASDKARLAGYVPNKALVEVEEISDGWAQITYEQQSGYVKTAYLRLPSALPGMTVYPDSGTLLLRAEPSAQAPFCGAVGPTETVTVLEAADGWAKVRASGEFSPDTVGYVETDALSMQLQEASGDLPWIAEPGWLTADAQLRRNAGADAPVLAALSAGEALTAAAVAGDSCLVRAGELVGFVPKSCVALSGGDPEAAVENAAAVKAAAAALKKKHRGFSREDFFALAVETADRGGLQGALTQVCFYSGEDQYSYTALVQGGKVRFTADYTGFSKPVRRTAAMPAGEVRLALSAQSLPAGGVLDIEVTAWKDSRVTYTVLLDGKRVAQSEPSGHWTASFRPREAGSYTLLAAVEDDEGRTAEASAGFEVLEAEKAAGVPAVFSQKDGWWEDKAYRKSNLGKSGCAIFTLSAALGRMGISAERLAPEKLAKTYALCLTPTGTNNERLLRTAGEDFGFATQRDLITSKKKIASLLQSGCMFSFSIARGHIALITGLSEDGTMVRIADSAPGATFERIRNTAIYCEGRGGWRAAVSLEDVPGARWYLETGEYGGLEYWMTLEYAAKRGVRLIQPAASPAE